jgi:hypothetical protein
MKKPKPNKPDPNCELCMGDGIIEEQECFQNAWGEHGLDSWDCPCTTRKKRKVMTKRMEEMGERVTFNLKCLNELQGLTNDLEALVQRAEVDREISTEDIENVFHSIHRTYTTLGSSINEMYETCDPLLDYKP